MKIAGTAHLAAPRDRVWAAFHDPAVLARTLPGCEQLRVVGEDTYEMTVNAGVGAIKGTYDGKVSIDQQQHPESFVLHASGAGAPGTVSADVTVRLAEATDGGTDLSYDADAIVGGPVGGVGQRMITGVAKKMAGQFFAAVDADIAGVAVPAAPAAPTAPGEVAAAAPAPPAPGAVFTPAPKAAGVVAGINGRDLLIGFAAGAAVALAGVLVGARAGRRRGA
jgi:carbon monoxide dehydrogenase subunit G